MQWGLGKLKQFGKRSNDTEEYATVKDSDYNQAHVFVPSHTAQALSS